MNNYQKLAAYKVVIDRLTAAKKELEELCKAQLLEEYRRDGTDRKRIVINDCQCGTYTARKSKPEFVIKDAMAFKSYCEHGGYGILRLSVNADKLSDKAVKYLRKNEPQALMETWDYDKAVFDDAYRVNGGTVIDKHGAVIDGVELVPSQISGFALMGVDADAVINGINATIPGGIIGFLEGGGDDE